MDIIKRLKNVADSSFSMLEKTLGTMGTGVDFIQSKIGDVRLLGSTETSAENSDNLRDEKHYFLIPDHLCELEYSLYSMRYLPEDVPPINNLPKHRIFHLPNEHALATVQHILVNDARDAATSAPKQNIISDHASQLADQIDQLDSKVFNGALLISGLVALINPVAGAAIAAKSMLPSVGLLLSKYGLKYVEETADSYSVEKQIKDAEKDVLAQFKGANTDISVNSVLEIFDNALKTTREEYCPVDELYSDEIGNTAEQERIIYLTAQAVSNSYAEILDYPELCEKANLGEEDIEFLNELKLIAKT